MKRIHLFEFEDQAWLPATIRTAMTNLIVVFHKMTGTHEVIERLLLNIREKHSFSLIVDIGSGSGGAMPEVLRRINEKEGQEKLDLLLTDLHPNPSFVKKINDKNISYLEYQKDSLDATQLESAPDGLKTMVNSFHHLPPEKARTVLRSAQESRQPFLIYEMAENKVPTLLWWLLLPLSLLILILMSLFMTLAVRPMRWQQLLFTYLIPVIPIFYAWDGQVSMIRMYTFSDFEELLDGIKEDGYKWEMRQAKKENGKTLGYYVLGIPVS
jgi:Flp pilus assembly protein TadB